MKYILDSRYRFRGWHGAPYGVYDTVKRRASFFEESLYRLLMRCDAVQEIDPAAGGDRQKRFFDQMLREGIVRESGMWDFLQEVQQYRAYPARYRREAHWSVTGECNLKCRHCFMSAPHAKHGSPSHAQIVGIVDQLAECGVFNVSITGGEPLIRSDLPEIIDLLNEREIGLETIYTNGWLVDEKFLDMLEKHHVHPGFQLSFDGISCHDFLRGVPGAEERTVKALRLLQARGYGVSVSMCLHRRNASSLRETVRFLSSLGVNGLKCAAIMDLGEWQGPEAEALRLTQEEELSLYCDYIPEYFEDDAPLSLMLSGAFMYAPGMPQWHVAYHRECPAEEAAETLACGVLGGVFYIGADGIVSPCQGMCDCGIAGRLDSLFNRPLREILTDSEYVKLSYLTVADVRNGNDECRACAWADQCTGGCRNSALIAGDNPCGVDPDACFFFRNGWEERVREAAHPAFERYLQRHPASATEVWELKAENTLPECL